MADVFLILTPVYPMTPKVQPARNVGQTANINDRFATGAREPMYHEKPKLKVFATKKQS